MNQAHWRGRTGLPSSPGELGVEPWRAGCRALASWVLLPTSGKASREEPGPVRALCIRRHYGHWGLAGAEPSLATRNGGRSPSPANGLAGQSVSPVERTCKHNRRIPRR